VLARLDLAYPEAKLGIEYDGAGHLDPRRTLRDRDRDTVLAGYGWETRRFGSDDLDAMPQTVARIRGLLNRRMR
jgi:very-short-patch-repair endonuclease